MWIFHGQSAVNRFLMELWESLAWGKHSRMFTAGQCRAARGLLGWSQEELARRAGVGIVTVYQLEAGISQPRRATLDVIRRSFEVAGIELTNGDQPGVRLVKGAASSSKSPASRPKKSVRRPRTQKVREER
jgi:transcriptional regulator with XRE-family HTH domain